MKSYLVMCLGGISLLLGSCFSSSSKEFVRFYDKKEYSRSFIYLGHLNAYFFSYNRMYNNLGANLMVEVYRKKLEKERLHRLQGEELYFYDTHRNKNNFSEQNIDNFFLCEVFKLIPIFSSKSDITLLNYTKFKNSYESLLACYKKSQLYEKDSLLYYTIQISLRYQLEDLNERRSKSLLNSYLQTVLEDRFEMLKFVHNTMDTHNFSYHPHYSYYLEYYGKSIELYQSYLGDMRKVLNQQVRSDNEKEAQKQLKKIYIGLMNDLEILSSPLDLSGKKYIDLEKVRAKEREMDSKYINKK